MEDVVVRYRAEVDEATRKLDLFVKENQELAKASVTAQKGVDGTTKSVKKLETEVSDTGKKLKEASTQATGFGKSASSTFQGLTGQVRTFAQGAAIALGAAFSVQAIVAFSKASINAFLEAQENAEKLRFAITAIGGEGEAAFERLIQQSNKLQKATVFSDDSLQQAQAMLATFGLTSDQIEELLPKLADFASVTKQDIVSAANAVGQGLQGMGREFKKLGIDVSANATELENLSAITEGFTRFQGAAAKEAETLTGQLKQQANAADDLQESIGSRLAPIFVNLRVAIFESLQNLLDFGNALNRLRAQNRITAREDLAARVEAELLGRAEINQLSLLENAKKKQIEVAKELSGIQFQLVQAELKNDQGQVRDIERRNKELIATAGILKDLISLEQKRKQAEGDELKASELKELSIERLNILLTENGKLNSITAQSNVKLINAELAARKKLREEAEKADKRTPTTERVQGVQGISIADLSAQNALDEVTQKKKTTEEEYTDFLNKQNQERVDGILKLANIQITANESVFDAFLRHNEQILQQTAQLISGLTNLFGTFSEGRIQQIEQERDSQIEALTTEESLLNEQVEKRQITELEAFKREKELEEKRLALQQATDKKIQDMKKKQAILDKAAALFQIILNTRIAATAALATPPAPNFVAQGLAIADGAIQAGIVIAQPIPYKKGSKRTKAGLAKVGEEGEELMMMPEGAKVLPHGKTKQNAALIDAMFDNRLESYVLSRYVNPALVAQKKVHEKNEKESFQTNLAKSLSVNNALSAMTRKQIETVILGNPEAIGRAIAEQLKSDNFR